MQKLKKISLIIIGIFVALPSWASLCPPNSKSYQLYSPNYRPSLNELFNSQYRKIPLPYKSGELCIGGIANNYDPRNIRLGQKSSIHFYDWPSKKLIASFHFNLLKRRYVPGSNGQGFNLVWGIEKYLPSNAAATVLKPLFIEFKGDFGPILLSGNYAEVGEVSIGGSKFEFTFNPKYP